MSRTWSIFRSVLLYLISFVLYFIVSLFVLGGDLDAVYICITLYSVSLIIALSGVGEWFLRLLNNFRPVETKHEREYLNPLFQELIEETKAKYIKLPKHLKLYIKDTMTINAYACGTHSVCVTKGAIETFSEDELKALISHELGHIYFFHTRLALLSTIGNGIFSVMVIFTRLFQKTVEFFHKPFERRSDTNIFFSLLFSLLTILTEVMIFVLMFFFNVFTTIFSRSNEYQADKFACYMGYGDDLVEALYLLQKLSLSGNMKLVERIQATHPRTSKRIMKLETLIDNNFDIHTTS